MGDLDKNIHRKEEPSPYEKIIINPIEKDRQKKEEGYTGLKNSTRAQIFATLASYFKKVLSTFSSKGQSPEHFHDQTRLVNSALAFKQLFTTLAKEDQSHNPDFAEQLSQLWHNLLDDCNTASASDGAVTEILEKTKFFISQIQNFPPGADHTLGFYFTQYAGKDWIPFPFMELLQDLHNEYQASPVISVLQNWILLLDEILLIANSS